LRCEDQREEVRGIVGRRCRGLSQGALASFVDLPESPVAGPFVKNGTTACRGPKTRTWDKPYREDTIQHQQKSWLNQHPTSTKAGISHAR